jgi:molybdate transport system substrate-binding protein
MIAWKIQAFAVCAAIVVGTSASAAEIKIVSSVGIRGLMEALQPEFERTTHHSLVFTFGTAAKLKKQLDDGMAFDVVVLPTAMLDDLSKGAKVQAASVAGVAKSGNGLMVRKGTALPDISSPERFKRALLEAKSVAYSKEGQSGIAAAKVIDRLGIAEQLKPRIFVETRPGGGVTAVLGGDAELAFSLISEIVTVPQVTLVGPVPGDLQTYVTFAAGVSSTAADAAAARTFVEYLRSPAVRSMLAAKGMESM